MPLTIAADSKQKLEINYSKQFDNQSTIDIITNDYMFIGFRVFTINNTNLIMDLYSVDTASTTLTVMVYNPKSTAQTINFIYLQAIMIKRKFYASGIH